MQRKVSVDDLKRISGFALREQKGGGRWWVCDEYAFREGEIVSRCANPWIFETDSRPRLPSYYGAEELHWREYSPLEETPDLFLKLASLHEEQDFEHAALAFCHKYGVPGGSSSFERGGRDSSEWASLSLFRKEAKRAWNTLRFYEAALNRDQETATRLLLEEFGHLHEGTDRTDEHDLELSLVWAATLVSETVTGLCGLGVSIEDCFLQPERGASGLRGAWLFSNLLGAAYLQMYWLMTSEGDLARCEYCARIISLSRPHPEGRKRRRDKRFCNDACRQASHRSKKKP